MCSKADGSEAMNLTTSAIPLSAGGNNTLNTGFPSFLPDGTKIVFRVWGADAEDGDTSQLGLRILHLDQVTANGTYPVTVLTNWWDTLPSFSPDGTKIVFTRRVSGSNYEVCTIAPDGSDLQVLTSSEANDAHACGHTTAGSCTRRASMGFSRSVRCTIIHSNRMARSTLWMRMGGISGR